MIVFVVDLNNENLQRIIYDVVNISLSPLTHQYELMVCGVSGNDTIYIDSEHYYIKVV